MIKLTVDEENFIKTKIEGGAELLAAQDWDSITDKLDRYETKFGYVSFKDGILNENGEFAEKLIDKIVYSD